LEVKVNIQIIGLGKSGIAQAKLMKKLGHSVSGYDKKPVVCPDITISEKPVSDTDVTFLCLPEKGISAMLKQLAVSRINNPYVIRSPLVPGATQVAMQQYGVHICHNPELTWRNNTDKDGWNEKTMVIGECCPMHGELLAKVYHPLGLNIVRTKPIASEMAKLALSTYFSTLATYLHEFDMRLADLIPVTK